MWHRLRGRTHLLSRNFARVSNPEAMICRRLEYACLPARAAKSAMAPWLSPATPTARKAMLDQCFSDAVSVHGNTRQLASVAVQFATDQFDPMTRHLACQFVLRLQRCDAFRSARSVNLWRIYVLDANVLTPAGLVVDREGVAIPDPERDILAGVAFTDCCTDKRRRASAIARSPRPSRTAPAS